METIILTALVAACFGALGYFGRRWIEQQGKDQSLNRTKQMLEINKQLKDQNLSPEDLTKLEAVILGRAKRSSNAINITLTPLEVEFVSRESVHSLTQSEMNELAARKLDDAYSDLESFLIKLKEVVEPDRFSQFIDSQVLWEESCGKSAKFVASKYKGGSIFPYIYLVERERLVRERIAQVNRMFEDETTV